MFYLPSLLLLQIAAVVHVLRTGRNLIWLWLIILLPAVGLAAYFIVELLPGLTGSRGFRRLGQGAVRAIDPSRDLRALTEALERTDTVDNRRRLAEEYVRLGRYPEAAELYRSALVGIHADDPSLLTGAARAALGCGRPQEALDALEKLRAAEPVFQTPEAHLLYAESLEGVGREEEAAAEYAALVPSAPGEEARCRYALLLLRRGAADAANALFDEILARARRADGRYRAAERAWIDIAQRRAPPPGMAPSGVAPSL